MQSKLAEYDYFYREYSGSDADVETPFAYDSSTADDLIVKWKQIKEVEILF